MLKHLSLENFRNYKQYSLDLAKTTIILGPNGIGKTNIMEAIYLLATGRSWRTNRINSIIFWEKDFARLSVALNDETKTKLEMILQQFPSPDYPKAKIVKINDVKKKVTDLLGKMTVVLFSPEEIQIIDGTPMLRRRMLDILICQVDHKYILALLDLAKIIRGRNKLLYYIKIGRSKADELAFWDEKLVILGSFIIKKRQKTIDRLNRDLTKIYQTIAGKGETLALKYQPSILPENFTLELIKQREREIERTATLLGPHRDEVIFLLAPMQNRGSDRSVGESKNITTFGSRGEYRSAILAEKVAELDYLKEFGETKPILLLDDIFSELDADRRGHLAKIVLREQTIITTTDLDHIEKGLREKAKIVELK